MSEASKHQAHGELTQRETELRVYDVDPSIVTATLKDLGAVCLGAVTHKRAVIDVVPLNPDRWIRVRTDGEYTTLAVKERISQDADGTGEHEIDVSDYDETLRILGSIGGYVPRSIQETRRTSFTLGSSEISIDEWPILGHLVEIESVSEANVRSVGAQLGFTDDQLTGKSVESVFMEKYGIDVKVTHLTFDDVR